MTLDYEEFSEAEGCVQLSQEFNKYFDTSFTFREFALLLQNIEALLMVLKINCEKPDDEDFVNSMDLISTVAVKLKSQILKDMACWLCSSNDLGNEERRKAVETSLKIVQRMRAWALRHPF